MSYLFHPRIVLPQLHRLLALFSSACMMRATIPQKQAIPAPAASWTAELLPLRVRTITATPIPRQTHFRTENTVPEPLAAWPALAFSLAAALDVTVGLGTESPVADSACVPGSQSNCAAGAASAGSASGKIPSTVDADVHSAIPFLQTRSVGSSWPDAATCLNCSIVAGP